MALSDELDAYQTYVEAVRAYPDDQELWDDLAKAKAAVEVAYLEQLAARLTNPSVEDGYGPERRRIHPDVGWTTSEDGGAW